MDKTFIRTIEIDGYKVDVHHFGKNSTFYYPQFNGNAEFPVSSNGFKKLRRYLRMVKHFNSLCFSAVKETWKLELPTNHAN